jgi:hypothetical protein
LNENEISNFRLSVFTFFDKYHSVISSEIRSESNVNMLMCVCFSVLSRNEFAYASSDKLIYIRRFSDKGNEMTLTAILQGHEAEVTQV